MSWSGLAKFLIGFFLAIAILLGAGVAAAYYILEKFATIPSKPIFPEELPKPPVAKSKKLSTAAAKSKSPSAAQSSASKSDKPPTQLEPGAYKARVTWPQGLSMRSEPNLDGERVGGIQYNERVVVLEESSDKKWQRVRQENSDQKGWVRAGNLEKADDQNAEQGNNTN